MNFRKLITFICVLFILNLHVFSKDLKLNKIDYNITGSSLPLSGKTQIYALKQNLDFNLENNNLFQDQLSLDSYIKEIYQQLENLRAFDFINIEQVLFDETDNYINFNLQITLSDSNHILAVPYPKYDSNTGLNFKLKMQDTNFLGTLNELSSDLFFIIPFDSDSTKTEAGLSLEYDYPFEIGLFNATWVNNYSFSYVFDDNSPQWDLTTGLKLSYPIKNYSLNFELYQKAINNKDYYEYKDSIYFAENGIFSIPIKLTEINNIGKLIYSPFVDINFNWDMDGINPYNSSLSSPTISIGHNLSASKINWYNNFRKGLYFNLLNEFKYNFQRNILYPAISFESQYFNFINLFDNTYIFDRLGFVSRFYVFNCFVDKTDQFYLQEGNPIGTYLRGIRDEQFYNDSNIKACTTISALILNIDLPLSIFTTSFSKGFLRHFNFNLQASPFIDIALTHNKITNKYFSLKDGFYAAGVEILVYPLKWTGFTVRGSAGIDMGRTVLKNQLNTDWRSNSSVYEISFGIGLQY